MAFPALSVGVLRKRSPRRLALAQLFAAAGDGIALAALPAAVVATGGSAGQVGIALAVQTVSMAIFLVAAGAIGDSFERRQVVIAGDVVRFGARCAVGVLLVLGEASFGLLLVALAVHGMGTALFSPAMDGFIPEVIGRGPLLVRVNAVRQVGLSLGMSVGPAIGGVLCVAVGPGWAYIVDGATFLCSALLIVGLGVPHAFVHSRSVSASGAAGQLEGGVAHVRRTIGRLAAEVRVGWRACRRIPWFWRVASEFAILNALVFAPFYVLGPAVANASLGGLGAWVTILVGLGIGELLGCVVVERWQPNRPLFAAIVATTLWTVPLLLLATVAPAALIAVGACLAGASFAVFDVIWATTMQTHAPADLISRLSSLDYLGSLGLVPLGYLLGAIMLGSIGAEMALVASAAILIVATLAVASASSVRTLRPSPAKGA